MSCMLNLAVPSSTLALGGIMPVHRMLLPSSPCVSRNTFSSCSRHAACRQFNIPLLLLGASLHYDIKLCVALTRRWITSMVCNKKPSCTRGELRQPWTATMLQR